MRKFISPLVRVIWRGLGAGAPTGPHVTRYSMYQKLARFKSEGAQNERVLSISGSADLCRILGFADPNIVDTAYPDVSLLDLPFEDNSFDALVSDQVLEHVEGDLQRAVAESVRVVKPGGLIVHATCLVMPMHMQPNDYWRVTPHGLRLLMEPYGEVIEADGWGTPLIVLLDALGMRHEPIPERRWHPGNLIARANRQSWPVVTWAVTRLPMDADEIASA